MVCLDHSKSDLWAPVITPKRLRTSFPLLDPCIHLPGLPKQISQAESLEQYKLIFSQYWRLEIQEQGASNIGFFWGLFPWLVDAHHHAVSSHGLSSAHLLFCSVTKFIWLFCDPMDCSLQAALSMGFPRQEYWSGLPFPSPGDLPDPGIKPTSPTLAIRFFATEPLGKPSSVPVYLNVPSLQQHQLY